MGKKKGKKKGQSEEPEDEEADAEGEESESKPGASDAAADTVPTPPPAPPVPAAGVPSDSQGADGLEAAAPTAASAADDCESFAARTNMVITGTTKTRRVQSLPYCSVCSMPFEFCEWSPLFKKCKENFELNWKMHFPDVNDDEELAQLMTKLGFEGGDAASKKAQSSKKSSEDGGGTSAPNKKKEKAPPEIIIELNNRNKKKHITVIKGLDHFEVDTAAAAKLFGKRFACGSALKKAQDGQPESIEIQGNYRDEIASVIVDKLKLSREDIVVLIDGKKVRATDLPS